MVSIIETQDGSHSLMSERFGVSYHSKYGAIQDSQHVFLKEGLGVVLPGKTDQLRVFEMGFGTGLNALLTYLAAEKAKKPIYYEAVEAFPITMEEVKKLNYPQLLDVAPVILAELHLADSAEATQISSHFELVVRKQPLHEATLSGNFDVVYYDAFGPRSQPELWERPALQKIYDAMNKDGVFVTYCAKGAMKRTMKEIGFTVEGLPGPPGKREMTRGFKR